MIVQILIAFSTTIYIFLWSCINVRSKGTEMVWYVGLANTDLKESFTSTSSFFLAGTHMFSQKIDLFYSSTNSWGLFFFFGLFSLLRLGNFYVVSSNSLIISSVFLILLLTHWVFFFSLTVLFSSQNSTCFFFISSLSLLRLSICFLCSKCVCNYSSIFLTAALKSLSDNSNICAILVLTFFFIIQFEIFLILCIINNFW